MLERLAPPVLRAGLYLAERPYRALTAVLLLLFALGAVVHQVWFWSWYIEDAAISFAYARNLAWGEGLVPTPGGERLEGYSNPTWVALLALGELLGFDSFRSSKVLQVLLVFATVPLTWLLAREASPRERSGVPLVAAGFLATSTTQAIWGAAGLENALFSFLLAAALLRTAIDLRTRSFPWAAFVWMLLALTRPEAILYAAVAGALTMLFTLERGLAPTLKWLAAFFVPFVAYHAVRFDYFAWELPQTYYGKMTNKHPRLLDWDKRGWKYLREWSSTVWTAWWIPLYALGLTGSRGWRFGVGVVLVVALGLRLVFPEVLFKQPFVIGPFEIELWITPEDFPAGWESGRSYVLATLALVFPLLGAFAGRGWQVRVLCWFQACAVAFFAIYSMGDWMKAWRWMSLLQVPLAVLFATGVGTLVDLVERGVEAVERRVPGGLVDKAFWGLVQLGAVVAAFVGGGSYAWGRESLLATVVLAMVGALVLGLVSRRVGAPWSAAGWSLATLFLLLTVPPNMAHLKAQRGRPETGPFAIKERVEFVRAVKDVLDIQHRIVDLDVDMGGHLWWGRDDFRMHDIAGLVDIPLAQHRFDRRFLEPYVFDEVRPDYVHLHGGWASSSRLPMMERWHQEYYEIPGYAAGARTLHPGNYIRRDLFLKSDHPLMSDRHVAFEQGWTLEDLRFPSEPGTGREGWLQIAVRTDRIPRGRGLPLAFVTASRKGQLAKVWTVPLAFDWINMTEWRADEVFVAGFPLSMEGLEPGTYDLGFAMVRADHTLILPVDERPPSGARFPDPPVFLQGEVVFRAGLEVVDIPTLSKLARADRLEALEAARHGDCAGAERLWDLSRWHRPHDGPYLAEVQETVAANMAICWAGMASRTPDPSEAVAALESAADWQHDAPALLAARGPIASALSDRGLAAWEAGDWEAAFTAYRDAVRAEPTRSWDRRWAEKARARMLGLDPAHRDEGEEPTGPDEDP